MYEYGKWGVSSGWQVHSLVTYTYFMVSKVVYCCVKSSVPLVFFI